MSRKPVHTEYKRVNMNIPRDDIDVVEKDIDTLQGMRVTDYFKLGSSIVHGLIEGKYELRQNDGTVVHIVLDGRDGLFELGSALQTNPVETDPNL